MYKDNNLVYILTVLEAIEKIKVYSEGLSNAEELYYANDQQQFNAIVHLILAIGEETKKIDDELKDEYPTIDWKAITATRNVLAHDYRGIDHQIVYDIVNEHLDDLKQCLIGMIKKVDFEQEMLETALGSDYYKHLGYLRSGK